MFVHLHGHSHYTILEGMGTPAKIVEKVKSLGMSSVAITDFCNMFGTVEFYMVAKKNGIKSIIGIEANVQNDLERVNGREVKNHVVLFAKNEVGYKNLIKLTSIANTSGFIDLPTIDFPLLRKHSEGLAVLIGGELSQIGQMILNNEDDKRICDMIDVYIEIFGKEDVYLEIIAQDYLKKINIRRINDKIIKFAEEKDLKQIVSSLYIYIDKDDKEAFESLTNIKEGSMHGTKRIDFVGEYHILSEDEVRAILVKNKFDEESINQLIQNNQELSDKLNAKITLGEIYFPNYKSPEDIKELYAKHKDVLIGE